MADASLTDILDMAVQVKVGDKTVKVYGVSVNGIGVLLQRFPEETNLLLTGRANEIDTSTLIKLVPAAIPTIIAAGIGSPGDEETEEAAARLPLETQVILLEAIVKLTMPSGIGPFVERLERMGLIPKVQVATKDLDSKSPKVSKNSRASDTSTQPTTPLAASPG